MDISTLLPQSLLADRLEQLAYLYHRADAAVDQFVQASGVTCPFGCGTCCEGFVPDILPLEAEYLATWLAIYDRDRAYRIAASGLEPVIHTDGRTGCPLYNPESPGHCTVYEARPLICRMFAFSAVRNKHGEVSYSVCRLAGPGGKARTARGPAVEDVFGAVPPVMADYGSELVHMDPSAADSRRPLDHALQTALRRVLFLIGMTGHKPENDGPTVKPTLPRAS